MDNSTVNIRHLSQVVLGLAKILKEMDRVLSISSDKEDILKENKEILSDISEKFCEPNLLDLPQKLVQTGQDLKFIQEMTAELLERLNDCNSELPPELKSQPKSGGVKEGFEDVRKAEELVEHKLQNKLTEVYKSVIFKKSNVEIQALKMVNMRISSSKGKIHNFGEVIKKVKIHKIRKIASNIYFGGESKTTKII